MKLTVADVLTALEEAEDFMRVQFLTAHDLMFSEKPPRALTGEFGSFRGYYDELHITYRLDADGRNSVGGLKSILNSALAKGEMEGYKGGEYSITPYTYLWLAKGSYDLSDLFFQEVVVDKSNDVVTILLGVNP